MKWDKLDAADCLLCRATSEQEISTVVQRVGAYPSGCKSKYPKVSRKLDEALIEFVRRLNARTLPPSLSLDVIKLLLRWCITDGKHLQDFRRDNARALWRVLFRGPFPNFYRYRPQTGDYIEDIHDRESWIQLQLSDCERNQLKMQESIQS